MENKIITLRPPVKEWVRPLLSLYSYWERAHRFALWTEDMRYRLEGKGGLDMFHVAVDKANPVAALDVSVSRSDQRVGCLHRLFVHPEHRHQGLARSLLKHAVERFRIGGGELLLLNSGWDTGIYHLYQDFGFREIRNDPWSDGVLMGRTVSGRSLSEWTEGYFQPQEPVKVVQLTLGHWAPLMLLCNQPLPYLVHHYALSILGDWAVDGRLLGLFDAMETGKADALGLETPQGALVGFATLMPYLDPWPVASYQQHIRVLDLWVHPHFMQYTPKLLSELLLQTQPLPSEVRHLVSYVETSRRELCQKFEEDGWRSVAQLDQRYQLPDGQTVDMVIYRRDNPAFVSA